MDTDDDVLFDNPRIEIVLYEGYLQKPYKYMYEKLSEKSAALDDHLMELRQLIAEENDFINDIGNPYHTSQSMISTVGKISCENETKLSAESCMIEMPKVSGSSKILLNLQDVPSFSIFPGAVFGLQGVNNNGKEFRVSKLLQPSLPEKMSTSVQELFEYNHGERKMGSKSVSVVIASGPYTLDESLAYEPFKNLMDEVETKRPDLLILMGPFVDENAAIIEEGLTFETVFSHTMGTRLLSYLRSNIHAQIVMIPSADDLLTESMVFPQPPLSYSIFNPLFAMNKTKESKKLLERIIMMPNPCVFSVNEMVFAATSRDVVFDIATEEISRRPESDDRVEGLVKHMLRQRT
jgi:DNA polymerase alpha subunit B